MHSSSMSNSYGSVLAKDSSLSEIGGISDGMSLHLSERLRRIVESLCSLPVIFAKTYCAYL